MYLRPSLFPLFPPVKSDCFGLMVLPFGQIMGVEDVVPLREWQGEEVGMDRWAVRGVLVRPFFGGATCGHARLFGLGILLSTFVEPGVWIRDPSKHWA